MYTAVRIVKMNACRKLTEDLEAGHGDEQRERERQDDDRDLEPRHSAAADDGERHQEEVAGEHVGEEPDAQREAAAR